MCSEYAAAYEGIHTPTMAETLAEYIITNLVWSFNLLAAVVIAYEARSIQVSLQSLRQLLLEPFGEAPSVSAASPEAGQGPNVLLDASSRRARYLPGPHTVHSHTMHLPSRALLIACTMCGTGTCWVTLSSCSRRRPCTRLS